MPVIHKYTNEFGYYIRANIDDAFVTFQVSSIAMQQLQNAGYGPEMSISWRLCRELLDRGHLYTIGSTAKPDVPESEDMLTPQERHALDGIGAPAPTQSVPPDVVELICAWRPDLGSEQVGKLFSQVKEFEACFNSIRSFSAASEPASFTMIDSIPVYTFSDPVAWEIRDLRHTTRSHDFRIWIDVSGEVPVKLWLLNGGLDTWSVGDHPAVDAHASAFANVLPDLFEIMHALPDADVDIGNWHFRNGRKVTLSRTQVGIIDDALTSVAEAYGLVEGPATGFVSERGYAGFGRISVDGVSASLPFTPKNCTERGIVTGDPVEFTIKKIKDSYQCLDISKVES